PRGGRRDRRRARSLPRNGSPALLLVAGVAPSRARPPVLRLVRRERDLSEGSRAARSGARCAARPDPRRDGQSLSRPTGGQGSPERACASGSHRLGTRAGARRGRPRPGRPHAPERHRRIPFVSNARLRLAFAGETTFPRVFSRPEFARANSGLANNQRRPLLLENVENLPVPHPPPHARGPTAGP